MIGLWIGVGLVALWFGIQAGRAYLDARRWGLPPGRSLWLALPAGLMPARYWWRARLRLLPPDELAGLAAAESARLGLGRIDSMRCPLCGCDIQRAWAADVAGRLRAGPGPVHCPGCDFRLDACRHCRHFQPGGSAYSGSDLTQGHCGFYKRVQPVEDFCPPGIARQIQRQGYTHLPGPTRILDSYVPLDGCRAFSLDERRLRANGVHRPGIRQRGLLAVLASPPGERASPTDDLEATPEPAPDEQWLL